MQMIGSEIFPIEILRAGIGNWSQSLKDCIGDQWRPLCIISIYFKQFFIMY